MPIIRSAQMQAFVASKRGNFENRMAAHLVEIWPEKCEKRTDEGVRISIREGLARALRYDIHLEYDVARYIDLMYATVDDFDINPQVPWWVGNTLNNPELTGTEKMDVLWERGKREIALLARLQEGQV